MKTRLDQYLVEQNYYNSREKAKRAVMAGEVKVNGKTVTKPAQKIDEDVAIEIKQKPPYVSRGGLKLEKGLKVFDFPVKDKTFLDIGASTGGFTDCLLKNGAAKVYAIDVGYGQLDFNLRNDERVEVLERTNFRKLKDGVITELADGSVMDVSFISILLMLEKIKEHTKEDALNIWLIKPQFEAGKEKVGKHGIIKDPKIHKEVLQEIILKVQQAGFSVLGLDVSPVKGQKGNTEFLLFTKNRTPQEIIDYRERINELTTG